MMPTMTEQELRVLAAAQIAGGTNNPLQEANVERALSIADQLIALTSTPPPACTCRVPPPARFLPVSDEQLRTFSDASLDAMCAAEAEVSRARSRLVDAELALSGDAAARERCGAHIRGAR